jgi:hypothetical protein
MPNDVEKDEEEPRDLLAEEAAAIMSGLEINDSGADLAGPATAEFSEEDDVGKGLSATEIDADLGDFLPPEQENDDE